MFYLSSIVCLALIAYIFYRGYKNTQTVNINHIKLENTLTESPATSIRILHISDMHLENLSIAPEDLYHRLKDTPVDLIALTGDFLDRKRSIPKLKPYLDVFNKLEATYGVYVVYGNHDYVLNKRYFDKMDELFKEHNFYTLRNDHISIDIDGKRLNVIGVDDFSTKRSNPTEAYRNIKDGFNLVLTHDPNLVLHMKNHSFDYLLSGHFHGGQIHWPKPYHLIKMGKLARMQMVKGLHFYKDMRFYISEGLGQTGVNIRFGSTPEITYHELSLDESIRNIKEEDIAG